MQPDGWQEEVTLLLNGEPVFQSGVPALRLESGYIILLCGMHGGLIRQLERTTAKHPKARQMYTAACTAYTDAASALTL